MFCRISDKSKGWDRDDWGGGGMVDVLVVLVSNEAWVVSSGEEEDEAVGDSCTTT